MLHTTEELLNKVCDMTKEEKIDFFNQCSFDELEIFNKIGGYEFEVNNGKVTDYSIDTDLFEKETEEAV